MTSLQINSLKARVISTHAPSANSVVRSMLKYWGKQHELHCSKTKAAYEKDIAVFFDEKCAYCDNKYEVWDHVIPMSKDFCGLHVWANLVPCCRVCNARKLNKKLTLFLDELDITKSQRSKKFNKIKNHIDNYGGENVACLPKNLRNYVNARYEEVNELTKTVINYWRTLTIDKLN